MAPDRHLLILPVFLIGLVVTAGAYYYDSVDPLAPDRLGSVDRPAAAAKLPGKARQAFVAALDPDFFEHRSGVLNPAALTRTYVRLATMDDSGDVRERILATKLEDRYTLAQILEFYLDGVDFGDGRVGVQAAALGVFHHDAAALTIGEAAVLGAMLNGPHAGSLRDRWSAILREMADRGWLTDAELAAITFPSTVSSV